VPLEEEEETVNLTLEQRGKFITELEERMREAARKFEFERAAQLRDRIKALKTETVTGIVMEPQMNAEERG
jgi:excinuclease ABC subunit B